MKLIDTFPASFVEAKRTDVKDGTTTLRFPFLIANTINRNNRVYPKQVVQSAVKKLKTEIDKGLSVFGSSYHPMNFELDDVSHLISDAWLEGDTAWAEAKILPTMRGVNLMTILQHGKLGVSARGFGSIANVNGIDHIQPDYIIAGVDFVPNPSFDIHVGQESVAESIFESASFQMISDHALRIRFANARMAGFSGDFDKYKRIYGGK